MRSEAVGVHFDLGLKAFEARNLDKLEQNRMAVAMLPDGGLNCLEHMALLWRSFWLQQKTAEALAVAKEITVCFPQDAEGFLELAQILNDLGRPDEAVRVLDRAVEHFPADVDMWFELGVAAERAGMEAERTEAFHSVWKLEHGEIPEERFIYTEEAFLALVERCLEELPPALRESLGHVITLVEDYPEEWIITEGIADPRILALFMGPPLEDIEGIGLASELPAQIILYRCNIERACETPEDVEREVRTTVLQEIGHFLGLEEHELEIRGFA